MRHMWRYNEWKSWRNIPNQYWELVMRIHEQWQSWSTVETKGEMFYGWWANESVRLGTIQWWEGNVTWWKGQWFRGQQDFVKLRLIKERPFFTDRESHRQMFFQQSPGIWCWMSGWKNKWMGKTDGSNEVNDSTLKFGRGMKVPTSTSQGHLGFLLQARRGSGIWEGGKTTVRFVSGCSLDTLWRMSWISGEKGGRG